MTNLTDYEWMSSDKWRALERAGAVPANAAIQKAVDVQVKGIDERERTVDFTITTGAVDRDNDTIDPAGWELGNFLKNPVVLFAHDYHALPIARALSTSRDGRRLTSTAKFVPKEIYPFADSVFQMLKEGFLSAVSVGFKPKTYVFNAERGGIDFHEQSLLEYSVCTVPSNPEALVQGKSLSAGANRGAVMAWFNDGQAKGYDRGGLLDIEFVDDGWPSEPCLDVSERDLAAVLPDIVRDAAKDLFRREVRKESRAWAEDMTEKQMVTAVVREAMQDLVKESVHVAIQRIKGNADYYV